MYGHSGKYATDKPPYCEITLRAVSDSTPPPDFSVSLTLTGGKLLEPITLERQAEHPSPPPSPPPLLQQLQQPLPLPSDSNPSQPTTSQAHEEDKMSNLDKAKTQTKNIDKHKSSDSAEPQSQDIGAGSCADSDTAPLPNSLPAPLPVSLSPSYLASSIHYVTII